MNATAESAGAAEVRGGVIPYLTVDGAIKAADFYARAFGATEAGRLDPDESGRTMHVHLYLNGGSLMLGDAYPEHGYPLVPPQSFSLLLRVNDVQAWWDRATEAGAEVMMPLQDMFWGDRYGQLRDPFGVIWGLAAPIGQSGGQDSVLAQRAETEATDRMLAITHIVHAPRSRVFEAWTSRDDLLHWAAPHEYLVTECEGDVRPGGAWRETMRSPKGAEYRNSGIYREIVEPERLVYTFAWDDADGRRGHETTVTVRFEEHLGKTEVIFRQGPFESKEERDEHANGWSQALERLSQHLELERSTTAL